MKTIFYFVLPAIFFSEVSTAQTWEPLGCGITGSFGHSVYSIKADSIHHRVFAGGNFDSAGCQKIYGASYWEGGQWHNTGLIENSIVYDFCMYGGDIYCANNKAVLKWQDTSWVLVGSGNGDVACLYIYDDKLIAGGYFKKMEGVTVNYIAQYDGATWSPIGNGFEGLSANVECLSTYNNELVAGGLFEKENGDTIALNNIARWDGTKWQPLTGGIPGGNVETMDTFQGELYVSGSFLDYADTLQCNGIAKWNGIAWTCVGSNEGVEANDLKAWQNKLFATSTIIQDSIFCRIAYWDGNEWTSIEGGILTGNPYQVDILHDTLYVGGLSLYPYNGSYVGTAMLDLNTIPATIIKLPGNSFKIYPNPAISCIKIELPQIPTKMIIRDYAGRILIDKKITSKEITVDVLKFPAGIYFVEAQNQQGRQVQKFVKL